MVKVNSSQKNQLQLSGLIAMGNGADSNCVPSNTRETPVLELQEQRKED